MKPMGLIGVTGATGAVGGAVAELLAEDGIPHRLLVRDPSKVTGDVRRIPDYSDMGDALDGVETLLLIPAHESADRLDRHRAAVDAAVAAGVRKIMYLSFTDARADSTFTLGRDHGATEEHIRASGLAWTFPRMNLYLDFLPQLVTAQGRIEGPAGDGRAAFVTRGDVAAVIARLLTDGGHDGETHDITGPEALSLGVAAATMAAATGRPIRYVEQTVEEAYASRAHFGAPDWQLDAWVSTYTAIGAGDLAEVTSTVEHFTGRPATSLTDFLAGHPQALDHVTG
jgi:NAD(P)H dehydrogenase (quinone)